MTNPVSLLFGVHAHQPIGNFPEVVKDAHERCYRPFLETLFRYPEFRFAVHFSGWLLDFLLEHYPHDMEMLRNMVKRGQVELFGAGDTEPVLAVIPEQDRINQIKTFSSKLKKNLGQKPQGAWLTERVWEATVVPSLVDCDIRYVIVDDYHFICAGKDITALDGYFSTEENRRTLDLFPISELLRYKLPFSPAHDAIAYLASLADHQQTDQQPAAIYFDDIEKFGIWPETYHWVYTQGWLEQFIQGVLASPRIQTQHFRDYHAQEKTRGIIYLPTTSYIEMSEWTLPATPAHTYADLVQRAKTENWYERSKSFLRGGIWKNFFSRYPESNWMHKRMLGLSARYAALPAKQRTSTMQRCLHASQANDAYWHGLFGGLYLPHLRRAIYNNLIELEALLDQCQPRPTHYEEDTDLDGIEEIYLQNGQLQAIIKRNDRASLCELDAYALNHNFADTLTRQTEHYHRKIQPHIQQESNHHQPGIASAHDRISFKHVINQTDLHPDTYPQHLFIDHLNGKLLTYQQSPSDDDKIICFQSLHDQILINKQIRLKQNQLIVTYKSNHETDDRGNSQMQTEINLAMPSCDGPGGRYRQRRRNLSGFGLPLEIADLESITLEDDTLKGSVTINATPAVKFQAHPHFSVSQSEDGFEKIMQAVKITLTWAPIADQQKITLQFEKRD
ncbi:MAG: alpha-amylase/4-alpha-glucanotransferase domain-containing protein [Nitrosomonas sp.]|nr:alpha-amylase/4-alpha-glucanotransferase domain-containing protein [Nitrosomonas sp.]